MTQEQFIQKWGRWLPYTDRDKIKKEMNDDLDLLIEGQEQKIYICSPCNNCDGNGLIVGKSEMEECPICKGKGFIREQEKPAKEQIIKTLYECAKITETKDGIEMQRTFEKEADAIIKLYGEKPAKEEREWKVGDMVRITKKLINQEYLEIGCEVEVVEYDAKDNTWWVEDVFCRYYGWITTEEAVLINKNKIQ